jgi:hypothetical protein
MAENILLPTVSFKSWTLTADHAASSYGQPVLVNRASGRAYGPADIVECYPSWGFMPAAKAVERMADSANLGDLEREFCRRFIEWSHEALSPLQQNRDRD